jgi:prepilin peptidase CpaA
MTISTLAASAATLCFGATVIWAGVMDVATMKIRNELVLFLLAIYAALAPLSGFGVVDIGWSTACAFSVLASMLVFFSFGWIGGGDAKLSAAITLWLGADQALTFVVYTALFGGVLTLAILQFRSTALPNACSRIPWIAQLHAASSGVPYGIAIASAALFVFPDTRWMAVFA